MLKLVSTATAAALFAIASVSLAQTSPSPGSTAKPADPSAIPAKCAPMVGDEREKCLKEEKEKGSASGGATGGAAGGATGATPSTPSSGAGAPSSSPSPSMPSEKKKE